MRQEKKKILPLITTIVLLLVAIFLFLTNIAGLINIYNSSSPSLSTSDNEQIQKLKQQQWAYEIQIRYLEAIDDGCLLTYHLPT